MIDRRFVFNTTFVDFVKVLFASSNCSCVMSNFWNNSFVVNSFQSPSLIIFKILDNSSFDHFSPLFSSFKLWRITSSYSCSDMFNVFLLSWADEGVCWWWSRKIKSTFFRTFLARLGLWFTLCLNAVYNFVYFVIIIGRNFTSDIAIYEISDITIRICV